MAEKTEVEFPDGIFFKDPHENAPNFVKAKMSIKIEDAIRLLQREQANGKEWLNVDILRSQQGKLYGSIDRWEPSPDRFDERNTPAPDAPEIDPGDDIPF